MKWLELSIYTTDDGLDPVCGALSGVGLDQVSIEESREKAMAFLNESAIYWDYADAEHIGVAEPCVKAYLADVDASKPTLENAARAIERLRTIFPETALGSLAFIVRRVDDADWENNWKQYYHPFAVGERLYITPCWENESPPDGRVSLLIDPGVAFGTGAHHTTRMCLELLEPYAKAGVCVADLGCGSGILSIAALLLGADNAVAVDIDPVAEHVARENAQLNRLGADRFRVEIGDLMHDGALLQRIDAAYDLVLMNIVAGVIIPLAPTAAHLCRAGGTLVVSGVIAERENEVRDALTQAGFALDETRHSEDWVAMRLTRRV